MSQNSIVFIEFKRRKVKIVKIFGEIEQIPEEHEN